MDVWSFFRLSCKFPSLWRTRNCENKFVAALRASKNAALAVPKEAAVLGFCCRRKSGSNFSSIHCMGGYLPICSECPKSLHEIGFVAGDMR